MAMTPPARPPTPLPADASPSVLVVDDSAPTRYATSHVLRSAGLRVLEAATGHEAIEQAMLGPSLIVLDINLPDRDGWGVITELTNDAATNGTPIVVLSIEEDRRRSIGLGAAEHLVKPVTRDALCAAALRLARLPASGADDSIEEPVRLSA